jgi:hypothetical protein
MDTQSLAWVLVFVLIGFSKRAAEQTFRRAQTADEYASIVFILLWLLGVLYWLINIEPGLVKTTILILMPTSCLISWFVGMKYSEYSARALHRVAKIVPIFGVFYVLILMGKRRMA